VNFSPRYFFVGFCYNSHANEWHDGTSIYKIVTKKKEIQKKSYRVTPKNAETSKAHVELLILSQQFI